MDDSDTSRLRKNFSGHREYVWNDYKIIHTTSRQPPPHYLLPRQNLHSSVSIRDGSDVWYREPFPYSSTYHVPFLPPNKIDVMKYQEGDPIANLVTRKLQWENNMLHVQKSYKSKGLNFDTIEQAISNKLNQIKVRKYEGYILHMLRHDPDQHFTGLTNWWHTGGRLCNMLIGGQMALLTSSGEDNEKLYVVPISDESRSWQPVVSEAVEFPTSSNGVIYQITCASNKSGRHNLVGVRQRNACTILSLRLSSNSFEQREDKCWEVTFDEAPFTSLDFNPYKFSAFCTASVGRQVSVWDSKKCCCVQSQSVPEAVGHHESSWCSVQYLDPNTIVMADTSTLMLLDVRQPLDKPSLIYCPFEQKHLLEECEEISLTFRSSSPSSCGRNFYFATRHKALTFDMRSCRAVQSWTHMMRTAPIYGHCVAMDGQELVVMGNQEPADVSLVVNDWSKPDGAPRSAVWPYAPPSLMGSRNAAQLCGRVLDPRAHSRLKLGLAGITLLPATSNTPPAIVSQTSAGDVFVQDLRDAGEGVAYTETDLDRLRDWEQQVLETRSLGRLKLTSLYRFKSVVKTINNPEHKLPRYKKKIRFDSNMMIPTSELFAYKDILASKLLEAWELEPPETEAEENGGDVSSAPDSPEKQTQEMTTKRKRDQVEAEQEVVEIQPKKKRKWAGRTSVEGF